MTDLELLGHFVSTVSDYAIFRLSPDGYVKSWNAGAQRIKRYSDSEIIGQHFSVFYPPEARAADKPALALTTASESGRFEEEGWRVRKDGSRFWASVVIDPVRDEKGALVGFATVTRDITDRKQQTEALRASEEQFRLLVQGVTDYAIYMLSPKGMITNWNAGAERFKGYTEKEVLGTHFSRFYTAEDRTLGMPDNALATAECEGRYENEGWRVRKDGSRFWAHVIIDALRNDLGELIGFAKITRDITERREAALKLEQAREALFQSQKLEAIGKLTGGVAHDFNNLLSVISNGLELISLQASSPSIGGIVDSMRNAAMRGSKLTQQLLAFARRQPLQMQEENINELIYSFEAVLRRVCDSRTAFEFDLKPGLHTVIIDAVQLEAGLLNLVTNARDAMPAGGRLTITARNVELRDKEIGSLPAGHYVCLAVADTGEGMSNETAVQAIEPFFTTKPMGKGTGLGLSQVYGLVQQAGGELDIKSRLGEGTTISLYLPVHTLQEGDLVEEDAPRIGRALLVDDQPDVLSVTVQLFKAMEFEVLSANNGKDALEILKRHPDIDLLFTDVMMPGINGIALANEARRINPNIEVLLTSGYPGETLKTQGHDANRFPLIRKPYSLSDLLSALGRFASAIVIKGKSGNGSPQGQT